jgi:hypothetical protein
MERFGTKLVNTFLIVLTWLPLLVVVTEKTTQSMSRVKAALN